MNKVYLISFLGFFLLTSCKNYQKINLSAYSGDSKKILSETLKNQTDFNSLKFKGRIHINTESFNQSANIEFKLKNDSIIWGSVSVLFGIEAFRFYILQNKIVLLDKLQQKYYTYSLTEIQKQYPIPDNIFHIIQQAMLGNLFLLSNNLYSFNEDSLFYAFFAPFKDVKHTLHIAKNDFRVQSNIISNISDSNIVIINYLEMLETSGKIIPKKTEIWVYLPKQVKIKLTYFDPVFNRSLEFDTKIPDGYKKAN